MKNRFEPTHLAGEATDEREPDRPCRPVDQVRDAIRVEEEPRLKMATLERAMLVRMRITDLGQVVQEELPEPLNDIVPLWIEGRRLRRRDAFAGSACPGAEHAGQTRW